MASIPPVPPRTVALGLGALLRQFLELAREMHPGASPMALLRAGNLFRRQLMSLRELRAWHSGAAPALQRILLQRPSIVCAVSRPYLNTRWQSARRLAVIRQHYTLLSGALRVLDVGPGNRLLLASTPDSAGRLGLVLDTPGWFAHEGELALNLFLDDRRLYSVVFSLGCDQGLLTAYIGALQGLRSSDARAIYRNLTHELHGLRPRELLLAVFRTMCRRLGVEQVLAISDQRRTAASAYFSSSGDVHTSYDQVWQAHGGVIAGNEGFFRLPLMLARRSAGSVPGRKRAQYRRRYAMLDGIDAAVAANLMR